VPAGAFMLCRGRRCLVVGVSAEYTAIDVSGVPGVGVGDTVTIVGDDGGETVSVEDVAGQLGAPSAAYWLVGVRNVPIRYLRGSP